MLKRYPKFAYRLAAALALAVVATGVVVAAPDEQKFNLIERGRYLATAADCFACHTIRNGGKQFAGGRPIETPFGDITSPNITPDQETGTGAWTDAQFDSAVRKGVRPDGSYLYPAMPYTSYTKMSRDDVLAIRAYLNTVEPVRNPRAPNTLPFPLNIRLGLAAWNALYFQKGVFQPNPQRSKEWNRGAYLVEGPGHCSACHTPKSFLGGDKTSQHLQGSKLQGWFAPDITNDNQTGVGKWSTEDIVSYLKSGHNRYSAATGPMAEEVADSTSKLSDDDVKSMAVYLKSIAGRSSSHAPLAGQDPQMVAGQAIYRDQCSACHGLDGEGVDRLFPSLADSSVVHSDDPATAIRLVLRGGRSVATAAEPTAPGMPSFAWQLDDAKIAAVLTYVRNGWGHSAERVTSDTVKDQRAALKSRQD